MTTGHVTHRFVLTIDDTDHSCTVTGARIAPEGGETQRTRLACGQDAVDVAPASFALEIDYMVDWNAGSLYRLLLEHEGQAAAIEWEPDPVNAPGVTVTGTCRLTNGTATGTVGQWDTGSASLPLDARPTVVDPS
jgi:hypothetical protein